MSGLAVELTHTLGAFALDAAFEAPARGVTALFGPSGSGKTTVLRCIAGLTRARSGSVRFNGAVWQDADGRFTPPQRRRIGYVFQEASLFPHLSVRSNLLYGERRCPAAERRITFEQAVGWLGAGPLLDRHPAALSGGERQRVAIARALLASPRLLLLDEPLSSLDEASRQAILPYLEHLHEVLDIPMVYVTHSLREVARLADRIVCLRGGRVVDAGPAEAVFAHLASAPGEEGDWVTTLDVTVATQDAAYALTEVHSAYGPLWTTRIDAALGAHVRLQIRARDVSLAHRADRDSSILNQFPARVVALAEAGLGQVRVRLTPPDGAFAPELSALITRMAADRLSLAVGQTLVARVKGVSVWR